MMKWLRDPRFLGAYAGVVTVALVAVVSVASMGFSLVPASKKAAFDEITVHRINVVEPDGTLRMTIADSTKMPGLIFHGREYPHPGREAERKNFGEAGMIFFDAEGSESGGLTFGGRKQSDGSVTRTGTLSFDHYDQDEAMKFIGGEHHGQRYAGLTFKDQPSWPQEELTKLLLQTPDDKRHDVYGKFITQHGDNHIERAYMGRKPDKSSALELKDDQGRNRIVMKVTADGRASLQLLDEKGAVIEQWPRPASDTK